MTTIYISSTYKDLKKERKATDQAIRRLGHMTRCMEDYVATDKRPVDKCLQDVRGCDIYVGIFAFRYGYIPDNYDKSITHLEYEAAREAGIPCLIFLLDENASWKPKRIDTGKERDRIDNLRTDLLKDHTLSLFNSADHLSGLVSAAVSNLLESLKKERAGKKGTQDKVSEIERSFFVIPQTHKVIINLRKMERIQVGRMDFQDNTVVNDIYFGFSNISRKHCSLLFKKTHGEITICDHESTFGTFIDDRRLQSGKELEVKNNSLIRFGRLITFEFLKKEGHFLLKNRTNQEKRNLITWLEDEGGENVLPAKDAEIYLLYDCDSLEIPGTGISFSFNKNNDNLMTDRPLIINGDKVIL